MASLMKKLVRKSPQYGPEVTQAMVELGNSVLEQSQTANWDYPSKRMIDELGGREAFIAIFTRFYERLFADPLMKTLFNESKEERNAKEHGLLLGSFVLSSIVHDGSYRKVLSKGIGHGLGYAHMRSKRCPMREKKHIGRGFTVNQSRAWLGHMTTACREKGTDELSKSLPVWLGSQLWHYGPFVQD
mmetsp:Transcript_597/g.770  ORF Transcript_597/g.770 Transcript_597/m.770 type:complete len:187 (-) Transcript_597:3-563(-)